MGGRARGWWAGFDDPAERRALALGLAAVVVTAGLLAWHLASW